jgi:hypothetical protein
MHTIVLYGGDFGNCHFRVKELPDGILVEHLDAGSLWSYYEQTDRNQDLTKNIVYNFQWRQPELSQHMNGSIMKLTRSAFV